MNKIKSDDKLDDQLKILRFIDKQGNCLGISCCPSKIINNISKNISNCPFYIEGVGCTDISGERNVREMIIDLEEQIKKLEYLEKLT